MTGRNRRSALAAGLVVLALGASDALAHGGFYKGPRTTDGIPIGPGGSSAPKLPGQSPPSGRLDGGPAATARDKSRDKGPETKPTRDIPSPLAPPAIRGAKWEHWWSQNQQRFLALAAERLARSQTPSGGSDAPASGRTDTTKVAAQMTRLLEDDSQDVRAAAAMALARTRAPGAADALRELLAGEKHADVRAVAVLALALLGEERDLLLLHGILGDKKQGGAARNFAALGVGLIGGPDAAAILEPYLLPSRPGKRRAGTSSMTACAYYGLGFSRDAGAAAVLRRAIEEQHHKPVVRSYAELGLGRLKDRDSLELLSTALLTDKDVSMRRSAALAVGMMVQSTDEKHVARLQLSARTSGDPGTRRMSALALGSVRAPGVRAQLEDAFRGSKDLDKPFFAIALGLQGDLESSVPLREALVEDDFEESLQAAYAVALGILGDRGSVPLLEREVAKSRRSWSPGYAALGLAMMGSRGSREAIEARRSKTTDPRLRGVLTVALGLLRDPAVHAELRERLTDGSSIYDRATAAVTIGVIGQGAAADDLSRVADDLGASVIVRAAAISALGRLASADQPLRLCRVVQGNNFSIDLGALLNVGNILNQR